MPVHTFTGPSVKAARKGSCPSCGKTTTRTATFSGTVNPFNKNTAGEVKTWSEVHADVQAKADAWEPPAEVFEHEACRAERLAPPVAEPVPVSEKQAATAAKFRAALCRVSEFTERHGLPVSGVDVQQTSGKFRAEFAFVSPGQIPAWARAFGMETVPVEVDGDTTYIRLRHEDDDLAWRVHAYVWRPNVGDRLGGATVEWRKDRRGRKFAGTLSVDELAKGLASMGIAEIIPTTKRRAPDGRV